MKKYLLSFTTMMLTAAAFAQGEGSLWWGFHHDTALTDSHLGVSKAAVYEAAIHVDGSAVPTQGTRIEAVRLPFSSTEHIDSLTLWLTSDLEEGQRLTTVNVEQPTEGWTVVTLPQPVSIPAEGLYVGYTFKVTELDGLSERPLVMTDEAADGGLWLRVKSVKQYREWYTTRRYGALALQLRLTGGSLQACSASADAIRQTNVVRTTDDTVELMFTNYGTEPISTLEYSYAFGQETRTGSYSLPQPVPDVYGMQGYAVLPIVGPEATGRMDLQLTLTGVNGQPNACDAPTAHTGVVSLQHRCHHRTVMEEYTGTWCSMCPRGFAGIARLKRMYPDDFIALSIHVLNGDPMDVYYDYYYVINTTQFPSCRFDRGDVTDPYDGDLPDGHFHADENFRQANRVLAPADLKLEARWTGDSICALHSSTDFAYDADNCDYKLAYVLIEDSLRGPEGDHSWHQMNSFSNPVMNYYVEDDMQPYVNAEGTMLDDVSYNDVVIAMSDVRGIEGSLQGLQRVGQTMTHDYELRLTPVSQHRDNVKAVCLLIDAQTKRVVNAAISTIDATAGISHMDSNVLKAEQHYDLLGRQTATAAGSYGRLSIVRHADGTVRKLLNK